jgi:POT family proton-dependent oligopeptide transporter
VYEGAFYQKVGLINLYIRDHVNRHVFGFEVPASWFNSITFISCAFLTPVVIMILNMIEKRFRSITPYEKLYLALGLMSICFFSLSYVFTGYDGTGDEKVSPWVIIGVFTTFGLCEILVWPPQMAAVSKLSPATYVTIAIIHRRWFW